MSAVQRIAFGCLLCVGLAGGALADVVVPVTGVTGHDGGNWPATFGHLSDMVNGVDASIIVTADTNPGMDTSANTTDPSTWTYSGGSWHQEWKANSRLDTNATLNAKLGWTILDFGLVTTNLTQLYLWNVRHQSNTENVNTYNVYHADGAGIDALPPMPNSKSTTGDYDFNSGDWTLLNTNGVLTLSENAANGSGPQAVLPLGNIDARYIGIEILSAGDVANRIGLAQVEVTRLDNVPPAIATLTPTNTATGVLGFNDLVVTFNELIVTNAGTVVITNLSDGASTVIPMGDPRITVSDETLTINPATDLDNGDTYAVFIDPGAIEDYSGNAFAGITDAATWQFTTLPLSAPAADLNGGFTNPGPGTVDLRGALTSGGFADAFICWGTADGGATSTGAWENVVSTGLAVQSTPFMTEASGLLYGIQYAYRVFVTNAAGSAWSAPGTFVSASPEAVSVSTDGLLGMWTFDDGTATDLSGNGHDGTETGTPTYSTNTPSGRGMCVDFNGGNNGILIGGDENDFDVDQITIATWVKELPDGGWEPYISKRGEGGEGYQLRRRGGEGEITFTIRGTTGDDDPDDVGNATAVVNSNPSTWYHLVARYDGTNRQIIINGNTASPALNIPDSGVIDDADEALAFGNRRNGTGWEGTWSQTWLDDVFIYDRALSDDEVVDLYENVSAYTSSFGIENTAAANVTESSADLQGILNATQAIFTVYAYYGTNDNADAAAWLADGSATNVLVGSFRDVGNQALSVSVSNLVSPRTYYYTFVASNAATNIWASPNVRFDVVSAETNPPLITSLNPTNGSVQVVRDQDLTVTFDEAVALNDGGTIIITNLSQGSSSLITIPDAQVSVAADVVTINPAGELSASDTYAVMISSNTVRDVFNNFFAGINDTTTWRFTMDTPPMLVSLSPTNSANDTLPGAVLVAGFNEAVVLSAGGVVTITNLRDGVATTITLPDPQVSVTGSNVTIDPASALIVGAQYAVLMDGAAVEDVAGTAFAGISDPGVWQFTVAGDPNWSLVSYWPLTNSAAGAIANAATVATEPGLDDVIDDVNHPAADAVSNGGGGEWRDDAERGIVLFSPEDHRLSAGSVGIVDGEPFTWAFWAKSSDTAAQNEFPNDNSGVNTLMGGDNNASVKLLTTGIGGSGYSGSFNLADGVWHHVVLRNSGGAAKVYVDGVEVVDDPAVDTPPEHVLQIGGKGQFGEDATALMTQVAIWTEALSADRISLLAAGGDVQISTTDAPLVQSLNPANGVTNVSLSANLVVTFDQDILPWAGNVTITNLTDGTSIVIPMTSAQVSVEGSVLTINPSVNLGLADDHAVLIDSTAIRNRAGTYFAGITNTATWAFAATPVDVIGPEWVAIDPVSGAAQVPVDSDLVITFDEPVALIPGGLITLTNLTDGSGRVFVLTNAQVSVAGDTVTIDPSVDLAWGNTYAVLFTSNAVMDAYTNVFAGITNTLTWQFSTDPRPFITALNPTNQATDAIASYSLRATFSEDIVLTGAGTIIVSNLTSGLARVIPLPDVSQVSVTGLELTINTTTNLAPGEAYAVLISESAIEDLAGNPFAGIADVNTWRFTTRGGDENWSLVAYWPLNDGPVGTIDDATVLDDLIDDPSHPATDATSNAGGSFVDDPDRGIVWSTVENNRLSCGQVGIIEGEPFTWSLWVKTSDTTATGEFPGDDSGVNAIMGTEANGFRLLNYRIDGYAEVSGFELADDTWHHVVVRGDGSKVAVYIDGVYIGEDTTLGTAPTTQTLQIGGKSEFSEDFSGLISDVAIWAEALPQSRISRLANGEPPLGVGPRPTGLLLIVR